MKISSFLILLLCLSVSTIHSMQTTKIKWKNFKNLRPQAYSSKVFNENLFSKKTYATISPKNDVSINQNITLPKKTWWNSFTDFFTFKKSMLSQNKKTVHHTNLAHIKTKTEQNEQRKNPQSYWKKFLGVIGAALIGGTVATMQGDDDPLSRPEFEDLKKFIELVLDPELEKRWNECKANPKCNEVICNANLITIINSYPYIVLKDHQFDRVINAKLAEEVIIFNNLNLLGIPKKTILFDGNSWKVVTEKIEGYHPKTLSLEQIQQLTKFVLETGYHYEHFNNLIIEKKSGKIFIIDLESDSFDAHNSRYNRMNDMQGNILYIMKNRDIKVDQWLKKQLELLDNSEGRLSSPSLPKDPSLEQLKNLDIRKVQKQAKKYAKLVNKFYPHFVHKLEIVNLED